MGGGGEGSTMIHQEVHSREVRGLWAQRALILLIVISNSRNSLNISYETCTKIVHYVTHITGTVSPDGYFVEGSKSFNQYYLGIC